MRLFRTAFPLLVFCASFCCGTDSTLFSQERIKPPAQEEIARYRELANPGPEHELLAKFAGTWDVRVQSGAGGGRAASAGRARSYMTMEGRFLWIGYEARGQSGRFKGAFTIGFDRRHEQFNLIAMDTDGTYFVTSKGTQEADTENVIKLYGTDDDPYMKKLGFEKAFAHRIDLSDPDKLTIDVLYIDTRTEERVERPGMKFTFTRVKAE